MRTLRHAVLREAIGWFVVYATAYLALIGLALGAPLVRKGAPLDAVALFLVDQFVFLGVIVLPLAMVTALLGVIGRMREEGEITALMAGGISTWGVARALLPLACILALLVAYASHWLMPAAMRRVFEGESQLAQQMIATQVARRVPIVAKDRKGPAGTVDERTVLAAVGAESQRLRHVFAVHESSDGRRVCYAPEARWLWLETEQQLGFDLIEPALIQSQPPKPGKPRELVSVFIENHWSIRANDWETINENPGDRVKLFQNRGDVSLRPETMTTRTLADRIANFDRIQREEGRSPKHLRDLQRTLHLRLVLPVAVLAYWAFACGLGLSLGRGNRLFAMCLGIVVVVATIIGPMITAKNLRGELAFDPGFILWPPIIAIGAYGGWLLWRRR
ncbi:MAG TPA: LptF/LptG family permease [Planctomycetota bacterium]|nr:LptF/LptG family permease [Planctomycetota bacterium]